jgi:hypothetical protein
MAKRKSKTKAPTYSLGLIYLFGGHETSFRQMPDGFYFHIDFWGTASPPTAAPLRR